VSALTKGDEMLFDPREAREAEMRARKMELLRGANQIPPSPAGGLRNSPRRSFSGRSLSVGSRPGEAASCMTDTVVPDARPLPPPIAEGGSQAGDTGTSRPTTDLAGLQAQGMEVVQML